MHPSSPSADYISVCTFTALLRQSRFFVAPFPENWGARLRISGGCPARGEPEALIDPCSSIAWRAAHAQRCTPVLQVQRRRPQPAAETGRSCWGRGQQDTSTAQGAKWMLGAATRRMLPCSPALAGLLFCCRFPAELRCTTEATLRVVVFTEHSSASATATTAASGGNREELLGPRPAGYEARPRAEIDAGSRNPGKLAVRCRFGRAVFVS